MASADIRMVVSVQQPIGSGLRLWLAGILMRTAARLASTTLKLNVTTEH
jgi:hypothetical protein